MKYARWMLTLLILQSLNGWAESLVRIDIDRSTAAEQYKNFDIVSVNPQNSTMDMIVSQQQLSELNAQVLIPDLYAHYLTLKNSNYFSHFHTPEQILTELQTAAAQFPDITELYDIGNSYNKSINRGGHDLWAIKISDNAVKADESEADILFFANIHAREIITSEILLYFMHYLLDNYNQDGYVTHLVNNREIWIIPTLNPDGLQYVMTGEYEANPDFNSGNPLTWRKNMADNNANRIFDAGYDGVDLNRNFAFKWAFDNLGSSPLPYSDTFRGSSAFSEPETQALLYMIAKTPFKISSSFHSYGNMFLYPWGFMSINPTEPAFSTFKALADSATKKNAYQAGNSTETIYNTNGGSDDWLYGSHGIYAFTTEVGSPRDNFWPDTTRILPLILENLHSNLYLTYAAGEEPVLEHDPTIDIEQNGDRTTFYLQIKKPVPLGEAVELDEQSCKIVIVGEDTTSYTIPAVTGTEAQVIAQLGAGSYSYYFEAADKLNRVGRIPRGAPMDLFSLTIAQTNVESQKPDAFDLQQNFPNPFNSNTRLRFSLDVSQIVQLAIYNLAGQQIDVIAGGQLNAGTHQFAWDGRDMNGNAAASGIYICRLTGEQSSHSIKITLVR